MTVVSKNLDTAKWTGVINGCLHETCALFITKDGLNTATLLSISILKLKLLKSIWSFVTKKLMGVGCGREVGTAKTDTGNAMLDNGANS